MEKDKDELAHAHRIAMEMLKEWNAGHTRLTEQTITAKNDFARSEYQLGQARVEIEHLKKSVNNLTNEVTRLTEENHKMDKALQERSMCP